MRKERISEALDQVKTEYIREAMEYQPRKKSRWPLWAAAACVALVCLGGFLHGHGTGEDLPAEETLPLLEVQFMDGGMGFEGLMFYDINESSQTNPWAAEIQPETLPVYENLAYTDGAGAPACLTDRELMALAKETAKKMGASIRSKEYEPALEGNLSYSLTAETTQGTIRVYGNGSVTVEFAQPWELEEARRLAEEYSVEDAWTDYTYSGEPQHHTEAWKPADSLVDAILNYSFARATYGQNEEGKVWLMGWGDQRQTAKKLGDYPVITLEEARELLLQGEYLTSVPEEYGGVSGERIAKEELIYRTGNINRQFQPYYRFYIELAEKTSEKADGLKTYGVYYVPAVSEVFYQDSPIYQ